MRTRWVMGVLCSVVLGCLPAGAQTRPQAPQTQGRVCTVPGLWSSAVGWVTDFSADGRWQTYYQLDQARRGTVAGQGTYSVDGTTMHFRRTGEENTYRYRVTLTGNECESMRLVLTGDDRQTMGPGYTIDFTRVRERQQ